MAHKDYRNNKRSICEMSMLLVANIMRLSCLSFTANLPPPQDERTHVPAVGKGNTTSVSKVSKSQRSQEPERIKSLRSYYLKKPEKGDPTFVRKELNDVDVNAEIYITQIRAKIGNNGAASNCFALPSSSSIVK